MRLCTSWMELEVVTGDWEEGTCGCGFTYGDAVTEWVSGQWRGADEDDGGHTKTSHPACPPDVFIPVASVSTPSNQLERAHSAPPRYEQEAER